MARKRMVRLRSPQATTVRCATHGVAMSTSGDGCERCYEDWLNRPPAAEMTGDERVAELTRWVDQLTIPYRETRIRIDELVGRSVYDHEIGMCFDLLCEEARNPTGWISEEQIIARAALSGKPVIVVRSP